MADTLNKLNDIKPGQAVRDWLGLVPADQTRKDFDEKHPGRKLEDMPGLTDEQRKNLGGLYGGRGRLSSPPSEIAPEREMQPAPAQPLWKRLFHLGENEGSGGIQPAGFSPDAVPRDWVGALKSGGGGGAGDPRTAEGIVERGVLSALRDFSAEQKGAEGGGGGGGGAMSAIRANYSPGGGGGYSGAGAGTGEPAGGGGAGGGGGVANAPMGSLPGAQYPTSLAEAAGGGGASGRGDPRGMLAAVRQTAIKYGINPDLMERVARGEGLGARYAGGDRGTSFGAMQLHRGGPGSVGTEFERQTGKSLSDPRNEAAEIDFAGKWIKQHGWGAWSAARIRGITGKLGVGIDTSRWSHELNNNMKPPHFGVSDIRERLQGAGIAAPVGTGSADVGSALREGSAASGVDLPHLKAMASIESSFNPSSNQNKRTQYKGLFQIGRSEWAEYLQHGGKGSIYNARDNAMAMSYLVNRNRADFKKHFGRDPTPGEIYMMHQQGLGFYTRGAMTNIGGNPYPGMRGPQSHGSFEQGWTRELEKRAGRYGTDDETKAAVAMHGDTLRRHFGVGQRTQKPVGDDLLGNARQAGLVGAPMQHKVTGSATLDVNFNGAPKGTTHRLKADGMFKEVKLNRGRAMPPANQEG